MRYRIEDKELQIQIDGVWENMRCAWKNRYCGLYCPMLEYCGKKTPKSAVSLMCGGFEKVYELDVSNPVSFSNFSKTTVR